MSRPIVFRPEAEDDLRSAWLWYEGEKPGLGDVFAGRVSSVLETVETMPELFGVIWQDVRSCRPRRFPYIIYYRVLPNRIEVLAVLHGSRDPSIWRSRV